MELGTLGWDARWEDLAQPFLTDPNAFAARVAFASRERLRLLGQRGETPAVLSGRARRGFSPPAVGDWENRLYRPLTPRDLTRPSSGTMDMTLIPYFAWANRGLSFMEVWIPLAR